MATHSPKNILITGAAGFIASHVANRLVRNYPGYKIVVLDKLDYCSNLKNLLPSKPSPNFKFVKGDIGSADLVNYLLITESIDTIMHFAAQTHVDNSFGNSFEFTKNNIYGTHVLLEACKVTGQIRRFIHVSTDEVYGETDEDAVVGNHEASQLLPTNPYSATKAGAEMLVMAYGRSYGLPVITTRGNNVYGPNQFPEKLIPKFILLAMRGQPLPIHGDGSNVRSYLYCEDVAEAFEVILHKGEVGHVYNIGTKKERRVIDVAEDICRLFSRDAKASIKYVDNRPFNDQRYFLDDEKLKNLGWSERTTWEDGLKKTIEWYTKNPDWWGDVSGALLPHPRMLMMPGGVERHFEGSEEGNPASYASCNTKMVVPTSRNPGSPYQPSLKFLLYGRTGWIGGLLGQLCDKQGIAYASAWRALLPFQSPTHSSEYRMSNRCNQDGNKGLRKDQKKYIPKNQNQSSKQLLNPKPTLSASFRHSLPKSSDSAAVSTAAAPSMSRIQMSVSGDWVSSRVSGGSFVNYLPEDEAVASGLRAEEGALDPVESQRVVDLLNRELSRLLKLSAKEFWTEVARDTSLHEFLDSFLKFRSRWYDFPHRGANGIVAGVIIGEFELCRRVFMVLYRVSSNRDSGARAADSLSIKDHGVLLQGKKLLDLPKLLDICAIYNHENEDLTRILVTILLSSAYWLSSCNDHM